MMRQTPAYWVEKGSLWCFAPSSETRPLQGAEGVLSTGFQEFVLPSTEMDKRGASEVIGVGVHYRASWHTGEE